MLAAAKNRSSSDGNRPLSGSLFRWNAGGYDGVAKEMGQLASSANMYSTTSFTTFDAMQSVTASKQVTTGSAYAFGYGYNLAEALTSETYPSGRVVKTGYDAANRQVSVNGVLNGQTTNYVTGTVYWANGGVTSLTRGNGLVYGETYNSRLQMAGISEKLNSGTVWNFGMGWVNPTTSANNGTLQSATLVTGGLTLSQTFAYDNVNRLLSANENGAWGQAYAYDAWGNMWMPSSSLPAPVIGPGMPTANVYSTQTSGGTNRNVNSTYDGAGNLTVFGSVNVNYDAESRQTMAGANSYYYDGLGQRVENVLPGGTTVYAYDAFGRLLAAV
jgi:YD repeat-containing protein